MKNLINPPFVFTPGSSGVGTIKTNITNFDIRSLYAIINITREIIIYAPSLSGRGYTAISGDLITLESDTSTHNGADLLQFIYESTASYPSIVDVTGELLEAVESMRMAINNLTKTIGMAQTDPLTGRLRVSVETAPTTTVTGTVTATVSNATVTTVTNQSQLGGQNANSAIPSLERMTGDNLRRNISVT